MASCFLIDSSAWMEFFKRGGDPDISGVVRSALKNNLAWITEPVFLEVAIGAKDFKKWKDIFGTLRLASVTTEVWAEAAKTGSLLAKKGITVPAVDLVIATVALKNGLTVLHRDKHFTMIAKALDLAELGFC